MSRIPKKREIDKEFRSLANSIESVVSDLNRKAADEMAKGKYEQANVIAERARSIRSLIDEVDGVRRRWRELAQGTKLRRSSQPATPLWQYFQPTLLALDQLGGSATKSEIEPIVAKMMASTLVPSDYETRRNGKSRWQVMVARSRKLLANEGWIEPGQRRNWELTADGRKTAHAVHPRIKKSD